MIRKRSGNDAAAASKSTAVSKVRGRAKKSKSDDAAERIAALEEQLRQHQDELEEMDRQQDKLEEKGRQHQDKLEEMDRQHQDKLEEMDRQLGEKEIENTKLKTYTRARSLFAAILGKHILASELNGSQSSHMKPKNHCNAKLILQRFIWRSLIAAIKH